MKYLIHYSLPYELLSYVMGAKDERTLATYIPMLVKEGAYNIEVEVQNNEQ